jgi:hypothetical protein
MWYARWLSKTYNEGDRAFYDAINVEFTWLAGTGIHHLVEEIGKKIDA